MATTASRVRRGVFTLQAEGEPAAVTFSCDPTAITLTPTAGDTGDSLEVLCGDLIAGEAGVTTWTLVLTAIQKIETADTEATSLALYALEHDGETAAFTFQPGPTTQTFYGNVQIVAIPLGGEVGGTAPTSDQTWPMDGPPTTTAPVEALAEAA